MAYSVPLYSTLNTEGVDLSTAFTLSTSTPEYPAAPFLLGTEMLGTQNGRWVYCTAAGINAIGDVCIISPAFQTSGINTTNDATAFGLPLGVSMAATTTGQYSWYMTNGTTPTVNVLASTAPNVQLYTSATSGRLTSALSTGASSTIVGIVTTTTSAATAGVYPGVLNSPYVGVAN